MSVEASKSYPKSQFVNFGLTFSLNESLQRIVVFLPDKWHTQIVSLVHAYKADNRCDKITESM